MSVDFIVDGELAWERLLAELPDGVEVDQTASNQTGPEFEARCLTDGHDYLWAYCHVPSGTVSFCKFGGNDPWTYIIPALEARFGVTLVDEHDDRYMELMGCEPDPDTEEES